jgi:ADP-heptose:LPS heptosyltransferase
MLQYLKDFTYKTIDFATAIIPVRKQCEKSVLIIKTDEIGDYILWRNFLPLYKNAEQFKQHKIVLCGNNAWKDILTIYDTSYTDEQVWLDKGRFKSDMIYRLKFLLCIKRLNPEVVINMIFSRTPTTDDAIAKACSTKNKTAMVCNRNNITQSFEQYNSNLYPFLIDLGTANIFDYYRNHSFCKALLSPNVPVPEFGFKEKSVTPPADLPGNYFIVFPGSGKGNRIWSSTNFCTIASFVQKEYGCTIVICGGPSDISYAESFLQVFKGNTINLVGKKKLNDFLHVLQFAKGIVSVDTGAVHLAASVQCPVFGIFNGSQYGRFAPYPKEVCASFYAIYPDEVDNDVSSGVSAEKYQYLSGLDYNTVSAEKLIKKIQAFYAKVDLSKLD